MRIGMVVAIAEEIKALKEILGEPRWSGDVCGFPLMNFDYHGHHICVVQSGAGEIKAAAATQLLLTRYKKNPVNMIANFGVCGGLTVNMQGGKTVVVDKVVHYDYDVSAVDGTWPARYEEYDSVYIPANEELVSAAMLNDTPLNRATCASGDKFISKATEKHRLFETYGAQICDMESAGILLTANRVGKPTLLIKTVSDGLSGGADEYKQLVRESARTCVKTILVVLNSLIEKGDTE